MRTIALSHLRLYLLAEQPLRLPAHNKGNSLRGGFGSAFRKLVCVDRRWECADCTLRYTCPYTKVFNPFIPADAVQFSGNQNIPRPFVIKPPLSAQTQYDTGAVVVFDLVLVGQAIDYLPYFIVAFRELGATGFGLNRAHVQLARVEALGADGAATTVYESSTNVVRPAPSMVFDVIASHPAPQSSPANAATASHDADAAQPLTDSITLEFLTPTTLKAGSTVERDGLLVRRPAFHHILRRLRDRANALATFYGGGSLELDFKAIGEAAEHVATVADETRWVERTRVSRRDVAHDLSGFVGRITFSGNLAPFLPLLRLGEYVHVGKNAVFGNGWFVIRGGA
jgi:CRISPR-associated endoribonuclease Cas6